MSQLNNPMVLALKAHLLNPQGIWQMREDDFTVNGFGNILTFQPRFKLMGEGGYECEFPYVRVHVMAIEAGDNTVLLHQFEWLPGGELPPGYGAVTTCDVTTTPCECATFISEMLSAGD